MTYCPNCGNRVPEGARFCGACGTALTDAASPPGSGPPAYSAPPAYGPPPGYYYQPQPAYGMRQTPVFFTGDWAGAGIVTGIGIAAMAAVALIAGLVGSSEASSSTKASQLIGGVFRAVALAAGGTLKAEGGIELTFRPLGLTLIGYTLIAIYFLRRLRQSRPITAVGVGLQAGRLGTVHLGAMLLVALLSHISSDETGSADIISTVFFGTITLAIALLVAWVISLPNLLPGRVEYYRGLIAGPMKAVLFLIVTSCAATIGLVLLLVLTDSVGELGPFSAVLRGLNNGGDLGDLWRPLISLILMFLPTVAGWAVLFGIGVPLTATGATQSASILDAIDQDARFWLWPVAVIALLVVTGIYSARQSPIAHNGRPIGWWLGAVLPVALFVLALSASISSSFGGRDASVGFDLLFVILLGGVFGLGAGMLGTVLVPRRPPMAYAGYPPMGPGYPPPNYPPPSYPSATYPSAGYGPAAPPVPPSSSPGYPRHLAPPSIPSPASPPEPPTGVLPPPYQSPAAPPPAD